VVTTHTLFCLRTSVSEDERGFLCGVFNSWVLNFVARSLMGGHLTTTLVESLPVPGRESARGQVGGRVARIARRLAGRGAPAGLEARLQAEVAHLYGLAGAEFRSVLASFPLVPESERNLAARWFDRG
jgi:hypothetical protein